MSYFGSAVHTAFRTGVATALREGLNAPAAGEELKVSWQRLEQAEGGREAIFADLLVAQRDISFQDMQSIQRAFREHLQVMVERTAHVNNIILGQAARHVIVHAGGIVDGRMIRQIAGAVPRTLKEQMSEGERVRFTPDEIKELAAGMVSYVEDPRNGF